MTGLPIDPETGLPFDPMLDPIDEDSDDITPFDNPLYASVSGRNLAGIHAELQIDITEQITLAPGLRADAWLTGSRTQGPLDPRLMTTHAPYASGSSFTSVAASAIKPPRR